MSPMIVLNVVSCMYWASLSWSSDLAPSTACSSTWKCRIDQRRHVIAERVGAGLLGARLIILDEFIDAGEIHRRLVHEQFVIDDAVQALAHLLLDRAVLQPDDRAAEHLRGQPLLLDRAQDAGAVGRV